MAADTYSSLYITLQIYAKAIYQTERNTEALARSLDHGKLGITEMCVMLEYFARERTLLGHAAFPNANEELRMLIDQAKMVQEQFDACAKDWESFKKKLKDTHWGVFGSASYAPIETPLMVIGRWPMMFTWTSIPWVTVRTGLIMLLCLVAVFIAIPLWATWLSIALLYDSFLLMYNGRVWLDLKHLVQRLRWTAKQRHIVGRMQEVESTIADLRMQVLLR
jgi:hypothetical protein